MQPPIIPPLSAFGSPLSPTPPAPDTTTIIIPQYGRPHLTRDCIRSLRHHAPTPWPVLVIDDGSPAADIEALHSHNLPHTTILTQSHRGVTAAWNLAARSVRTPWLIFLNNDVLFRGPAIAELLHPLTTGRTLISGTAWRTESALPHELLNALPTRQLLQGWCLAMHRSTLIRLGGFDASLHTWFSDTDLQLRAVMTAPPDIDHPLICCPSPHLHHRGRATTRHNPHRHRLWRADRDTFTRIWRHRLDASPAATSETR